MLPPFQRGRCTYPHGNAAVKNTSTSRQPLCWPSNCCAPCCNRRPPLHVKLSHSANREDKHTASADMPCSQMCFHRQAASTNAGQLPHPHCSNCGATVSQSTTPIAAQTESSGNLEDVQAASANVLPAAGSLYARLAIAAPPLLILRPRHRVDGQSSGQRQRRAQTHQKDRLEVQACMC
jgi:hypothetical protein